MLNALILKYEGEIAIAKANIDVYLNHPAGIGEHSDIVQEVDKQIGVIAESEDKLRTIEAHYPKLVGIEPEEDTSLLIRDFEE